MGMLPVPDIMMDSIYELTPERYMDMGKKLLLLDLDNTLSPYELDEPTQALIDWTENFKAGGVKLFILSNNKGDRPKRFSEALNIGYVNRARKPSIKVLTEVLEELGYGKEETALMGDQIYTDALCAVRAGIDCIIVRPIMLKKPWLALRYWAEMPFRWAYTARRRAAREISG